LKDVYEAAIKSKSTKHQDKTLEQYKADAQVVIDKLSAKLDADKYLAGDAMTLADIMGSVFI
jgi:glutathione S-transferase